MFVFKPLFNRSLVNELNKVNQILNNSFKSKVKYEGKLTGPKVHFQTKTFERARIVGNAYESEEVNLL